MNKNSQNKNQKFQKVAIEKAEQKMVKGGGDIIIVEVADI